jgi:hypothetical protein
MNSTSVLAQTLETELLEASAIGWKPQPCSRILKAGLMRKLSLERKGTLWFSASLVEKGLCPNDLIGVGI